MKRKVYFCVDKLLLDYYKTILEAITNFLPRNSYEIFSCNEQSKLRQAMRQSGIIYTFSLDNPDKSPLRLMGDKANLINPIFAQQVCIDKTVSDKFFRKFALPVPPSICTWDPKEVKSFVAKHEEVIFKEIKSCSGAGHFVAIKNFAFIGNKKRAYSLVKEDFVGYKVKIRNDEIICYPPYYVQALLRPDLPMVWRIYLVGNKVVFYSRRYKVEINNPKDYIINAARGANYHLEDKSVLTDKEVNKVRELIRHLNLGIATVDFIIHNGKPYFLEMDCDGIYTFICRGFKKSRNYSEKYNLECYIAHFLEKAIK